MRTRIRHLRPMALSILATLALAMIVVGGCDQGDSASNPFDDAAIAAEGQTLDATAGIGPLAGLTVDQIDARVKLTAEQKTALAVALDKAREGRRERMAERGRDVRQGRPFRGRAAFGPAAGDPPALVFLEDASEVLTPDQFVGLAQMLAEQRDHWMAERQATRGQEAEWRPGWGRGEQRGRRGQGEGPGLGLGLGPWADRAAKVLDLTDAQRTKIRGILESRADEMREIHQGVASRAMTREAARDRIHTIRTETRDQMKGILTAEQWQKVEAFRSDRMGERIDARLDRMEEQLTRRASFLERVLGLNADQANQVREVMLGTVPARRENLSAVKAGTLDPEDAAGRVIDLEKETAEKIGAILTPDQKVRWDALRDLLPAPGQGRGMGPGHGPGPGMGHGPDGGGPGF